MTFPARYTEHYNLYYILKEDKDNNVLPQHKAEDMWHKIQSKLKNVVDRPPP